MKKYFNRLLIVLLFAIACIFLANSNVHANDIYDTVEFDTFFGHHVSLSRSEVLSHSSSIDTNFFIVPNVDGPSNSDSFDCYTYDGSKDCNIGVYASPISGGFKYYLGSTSPIKLRRITYLFNSSTSTFKYFTYHDYTISTPDSHWFGYDLRFSYSECNIYNISYDGSTYTFTDDILYNSSLGGTPERGTGESGNTGDSTESTGGDSGNTTDSDDNSGFFASVKESLGFLIDFFKTLIDLLNPATFLKGVIESIGSIGDLLKFDSESSGDSILVKIFDVLSYINPLSDNFILKDIIGFFITLLDYLNPFSDNFILLKLWDFFTTLISYINPLDENFFGYKIMDLLSELLKALFVPDEERITAIQNTISSKFDFVDSIKIASNSISDMLNNMGNAPKLTINVSETKYTEAQNLVVLDLSFYKPFKPYGDLILTGFIYIFFLWRLFISLPNIIHGLGGAIQSDYMVSDIQAYNKFGFGRSASLNTYQYRKNGGVYRK